MFPSEPFPRPWEAWSPGRSYGTPQGGSEDFKEDSGRGKVEIEGDVVVVAGESNENGRADIGTHRGRRGGEREGKGRWEGREKNIPSKHMTCHSDSNCVVYAYRTVETPPVFALINQVQSNSTSYLGILQGCFWCAVLQPGHGSSDPLQQL